MSKTFHCYFTLLQCKEFELSITAEWFKITFNLY